MADRACAECGADIAHKHHFSKYCDDHTPAKPVKRVRKTKPYEAEGRYDENSDHAGRADVTPDERAAFKETQAPSRGEGIVARREREIAADRKNSRVNIGGFNLKMEVHGVDGMQYRWVNDVNGRTRHLENRGYTLVSESDGVQANNTGLGTNITQVVGTKEGGGEMTAHLMQIPKSVFEEDQATKRKELDKFDEALNRGEQLSTEGHDMSHQYSDVKLTRG